jgi:hypothetical protein
MTRGASSGMQPIAPLALQKKITLRDAIRADAVR